MKSKKHKYKPRVQVQTTTLTTEEEERKFRQERGYAEEMDILPLQEQPFPFVTYSVHGQTGLNYTVEIRSLLEAVNSCSCPDFQVNSLGTCKHIERTLRYIQEMEQKTPSKKISGESPFVEVYLGSAVEPRVSVAWPKQESPPEQLKQMIAPFFSSNGTLISNPIYGIPSLENALTEAAPEMQGKIRISPHLQAWVVHMKRQEANKLSREQYLEDVKMGKRSMQMLTVPLYPYQEEGMLHLAFQGRALLADEMGLGKTIQAIAACELLRRLQNIRRVLVISPASLKGEWEEQIAKFTGLPTLIVRGTRADRLEAYKKEAFFFLTNYEQVRSDFEEIQNILVPDVIILDEAQRIKNWQTKTAWAVKQLKTPYAFVLTGTPIENRIDEIYSIMQVVDPFILGPLFKFNRDFYQFNEKGKPSGYRNLTELHQRLKPVLLRRLKKDVEEQLPERTINNYFVDMDPEQLVRYNEYQEKVVRLLQRTKKRPLTPDEAKDLQKWLACMRMLCDTPYILDEECRVCPKLEELKEILSEILENDQNKIIIFSEWERMLSLVRDWVTTELKAEFAWHTGTVPQEKRLEDIKRFKNDPACRFFLTTDSGSTGLNLQCANIVINLDLPWNPAKLEQRIARAWRKNQTRVVHVINLVCEDSIEKRMLTTLAQKQTLAYGVLDGKDDLDQMPMPSARMDIVQQLGDLLETSDLFGSAEKRGEPSIRDVEKRDSMDMIKNNAIAHFNDRIHAVEVHKSPSGQRTMVAVVDKLDAVIEPKMQEWAHAYSGNGQEEGLQLELLDQQTYALLQRLAKAGVISINSSSCESLYRSPEAGRDLQTEHERIRKEARKHISEAERSLKMMNLLVSGEFIVEALKPAAAALTSGLNCYETLKKTLDKGGQLLQEQIQACNGESEQAAFSLIEQVNQYLQHYSEEMNRFTLG